MKKNYKKSHMEIITSNVLYCLSSLARIDFLHLVCCGLCSIDVSIVKIISHCVSTEIKSIYECWICVAETNPLRSIQPRRAFACTLRGLQAFTAKWGDASSFNAQSHRNRGAIHLTHYVTLMLCGVKREVQNAAQQIFLSSKHKWSGLVFNLLLCWADNVRL